MKNGRFEAMLALCEAMEWASDTETVYQRIVDVCAERLECDTAHLHLLDIDGTTFVRHASFNNVTAPEFRSISVSNGVGRMARLIESRDLIVMDYEHPHEEDVIPKEAIEGGYKSAISIPLCSSSSVLGMLSIVYKCPLPWSEDDYGFLLGIGRVIGVFVHRIQMSKKELELHMLRERKQLSAEIHDNLSQMVSALAIRCDIAQSCLDENDLEALGLELEELGKQTRQVTKVLREEMLSLRASFEGAGDVRADLASILERFQEQWGVKTHLDCRCELAIASEYVRLQLARIVNECLQNVLRHARASNVYATLNRRNGHVLISIRDDGHGFNVATVPQERLGIRIMRERAKSAGGSLSVASGSTGTTVFIDVPAVRLM